jgi:ComF family protein
MTTDRLKAWGRFWADGALRLCFPPMCEFCQGAAEEGRLCDPCKRMLLAGANARLCAKCGGSLGEHLDPALGCFLCRNDSFAFETVYRLGRYAGDLGLACLSMKTEHGERLAFALGDLIAEVNDEAIRKWNPSLVVSIPHHWRRWYARGYNSAEAIAERFAKRFRIPLRLNVLRRIRHTPEQHKLPPSERRVNVRGAFLAKKRKELAGATVLLVDDVLTTGSTCHYAAKALKGAGVKAVIVAVAARGEDVRTAVIPGVKPENANL